MVIFYSYVTNYQGVWRSSCFPDLGPDLVDLLLPGGDFNFRAQLPENSRATLTNGAVALETTLMVFNI